MATGSNEKKGGQVIVEMLLILPVFLTIVFTIMEMGNIAFQMILLNHATWEVARIGAMTATPRGGGSPGVNSNLLKSRLQSILASAEIKESHKEATVLDRQAGQMNYDLVITSVYPIPLIFPISSIMLSKPKGSGKRRVFVTIRMPIEQPLFK